MRDTLLSLNRISALLLTYSDDYYNLAESGGSILNMSDRRWRVSPFEAFGRSSSSLHTSLSVVLAESTSKDHGFSNGLLNFNLPEGEEEEEPVLTQRYLSPTTLSAF